MSQNKEKEKVKKNNISPNYHSLSKSLKAGLVFPVGRTARYLRQQYLKSNMRLSETAPVYFSAVLEYLCAEVLELAGQCAKQQKLKRITPRHIMLAIRSDQELDKLFKNKWIATAGTIPMIHKVLLKKKTNKNLNLNDDY